MVSLVIVVNSETSKAWAPHHWCLNIMLNWKLQDNSNLQASFSWTSPMIKFYELRAVVCPAISPWCLRVPFGSCNRLAALCMLTHMATGLQMRNLCNWPGLKIIGREVSIWPRDIQPQDSNHFTSPPLKESYCKGYHLHHQQRGVGPPFWRLSPSLCGTSRAARVASVFSKGDCWKGIESIWRNARDINQEI